MHAGPKLTLLAASLVGALALALPGGTGAGAEERPDAAAPAPTEQQTPSPATGGCPYRGGKLELIA